MQMCSRQISSNCVMPSCQYGPRYQRNVSSTLFNLHHEKVLLVTTSLIHPVAHRFIQVLFFNIQVSCMMTLTHSHTQADALGEIWRSVSCPTSRMEKTGGQFNFLQWATTAAPVHHIVYLVEFLVTHVVYPEIIPVPKVIMSLFEQLLYNMLCFDSNIFLMVLWLCFAYIVIEITFQYVHCLQYIFTTLRFILIMTCMQIIFTPIRRSWQ